MAYSIMEPTIKKAGINPRFLNYCRVHGRTPDEQLAHDREEFPGGHMAGFILWLGERWHEWRTLNGKKRDYILSEDDHRAFDAWLNTHS